VQRAVRDPRAAGQGYLVDIELERLRRPDTGLIQHSNRVGAREGRKGGDGRGRRRGKRAGGKEEKREKRKKKKGVAMEGVKKRGQKTIRGEILCGSWGGSRNEERMVIGKTIWDRGPRG